MFRNWFGFLYDAAEEWLDEAASAVVELGEAVPERRGTDKALYVSLATVCGNDALDVVTDGFKKRLKSETQMVDFREATGEVCSDELKCATVLSRSPGPIRTYWRVSNRGDHAALVVFCV